MELFDIYYYTVDPDTGVSHSRKFLKTVRADKLLKEIAEVENVLLLEDPNFEVDYEPHFDRREKIDEMKKLLSRVYELADDLG